MKGLRHILTLFFGLLPSLVFAAADGDSGASDEPKMELNYRCDPLPKKWLEKIEPFLRNEFDFYTKIGLDVSFSVDILSFKYEDEGYEYMNKHYGERKWISESGVRTAGIYIPSHNVIGIFGFSKDTDRALSTVYHEISHSFTDKLFSGSKNYPPIWLHEGLAEYFEHSYIRKGRLVHELDDRMKGALKTKYLLEEIDLKTFIDTRHKKFMSVQHTDGGSSYRLSYVLLTFLIEEIGTDYLKELVSGLKSRTGDTPLSEIIDRTYPGGFSAFDKDLQEFICK